MQKLSFTPTTNGTQPTSTGTPARATNSPVDSTKSGDDNLNSLGARVGSTSSSSSMGNIDMNKGSQVGLLITLVIAVGLGVMTGFGGYKLSAKQDSSGTTSDGTTVQRHPGDNVKVGDVFGSADEKAFKDSAEGYLEIGGIEGEGSHKLLRIGGDSQTVYLTSSVIDLDKFQGMEVKVWGETFKGQKAGWLMDVGRVQVTNTQGKAPSEE